MTSRYPFVSNEKNRSLKWNIILVLSYVTIVLILFAFNEFHEKITIVNASKGKVKRYK